jgi:hypothetical protein
VKNLRLAWLAAQEYGLIDAKTGEADFAKLRQMAPELFAVKPTPTANAGSGAKQNGVADGRNMNDWIRLASGDGARRDAGQTNVSDGGMPSLRRDAFT